MYRRRSRVLLPVLAVFLLFSAPSHTQTTGQVRYGLGSIPDMTAWHDHTTRFFVHWDDSAAASFTVDSVPQPSGTMEVLDLGVPGWLFQYRPDASDKADLTVTLTGSRDGETLAQTFVIRPEPLLPPEQTVFGTAEHTQPVVTTHEIQVFERKNPVQVNLNYSVREVYRVQVVGELVEIEEGHANGLYDAYFTGDRGNIQEMEIIGETVVFRSPARLKQTNVTIYARELRFEADGQLKTTPEERLTSPGQESDGTGKPGVDGLDAGDVTLHIGSFFTETSGPVIDLAGGRGQPGGPGQSGVNGASLSTCWSGKTVCDSGACSTYTAPPGWCLIYWNYYFVETYVTSAGETGWPTDGTDARPSGKPGVGGAGGTLTVNGHFPILAEWAGGTSGQPPIAGSLYYGGAAGWPYKSVKVKFHLHWYLVYWEMDHHILGTRETSFGANAPVPRADAPAGPDGGVVEAGSSHAWLHPLLLRKILNHARDDYLGERIPQAEARLRDYLGFLGGYAADPAWAGLDPMVRFELEQMHDEMAILLQQIDNNLDYFGNPAGWVPMLSFEVNTAIFDQEIDRAIRMLYLAYWIGNTEATEAEKAAALGVARDQLRAEIAQAQLDYDDAVARVPLLRNKAQNLSVEIHETQMALEAKENELLNQTMDPDWLMGLKLGLKGAAMACQMMPVYQPAFGAVGEGLRLVSNIDPDRPWESIFGAASAASTFLDSGFDSSATEQQSAASGVDPDQVESKSFDYLGALKNASAGLSAGISDISSYLAERKAPTPEMLAELERLKSMSPEYRELVEQVEGLMEKNREFTDELISTMQIVARLSDIITRNILAIDAMNRDAAPGLLVCDGRATAYLDDMARRAMDRLLKYHYYMAKAYEYRLLRPYTEPLSLEGLFQKFQEIAGLSSDHQIPPDQFLQLKALYEDRIASVAETIFSDYNANRPELSVPIRFGLTSEEIATLNADGVVSLNLFNEGFFLHDEENIRIYDFKVLDMTTVPRGGAYGRVASVDVSIEHSGRSNIKSDGAVYQFCHYTAETENPIVWGARYDAVFDIIDPIEPSAASDSLLCALLASCTDPEDIMLYSRPSAWADLHISRSVRDSTGQGIDITSLQLELVFDFTRRNESLGRKDLEIVVTTAPPEGQTTIGLEASGFQPYFVVGRPDFNQRQDGRGRFMRIYTSTSEPLLVTAQESYGAWEFDRWTDVLGNDLPGGPFESPTLSVDLTSDQILCAQYVPSGWTGIDNCPHVPNAIQWDGDGNGIGDACQCGDTTGDGFTNVADALSIARGEVPASDPNFDKCDVNGDGACNVADALMIARGLTSSLPEMQLCPAYFGAASP